MAENNVRSAPAGPVPDITVKDYHLGEILNELNCWCTKWKGNINAVYNNALSMADQIAQLFQVVYTTVEAQEDVTGAFKQLYDFVNDYFTNLDLQDEIDIKIDKILSDGTLQSLINNILSQSKQKILFIGDSYGKFLDDGLNYPELSAQNIDCAYTKNCYDGAGFVGTADKTFYDLFNESWNNTYTMIIIAGGYNDKDIQYNNLLTAVKTTISNIRSKTQIPIIVASIGATIDSNQKYKLATCNRLYSESNNFPNVHYIDGSKQLAFRYFLAQDGVHPGNNGQAMLALMFSNAILGCYNSMYTQPLTTQTFITNNELNITKPAVVNYILGQQNDNLYISINPTEFVLGSPIATIQCAIKNKIDLGEFSNSVIYGSGFNSIPGFCVLRGSKGEENHFYNINCYYTIENGHLIINPINIDDQSGDGYGGLSWLTLKNVNTILIPKLVFTGTPYLQ